MVYVMRYFTLFVLSLALSPSFVHAGKTFEELDKARLKRRFDRVIEAQKNYYQKNGQNQVTYAYQAATILNLLERKRHYSKAKPEERVKLLESNTKEVEHYLWVKGTMFRNGLLRSKKETPKDINNNNLPTPQPIDDASQNHAFPPRLAHYFNIVEEAFNNAWNDYKELPAATVEAAQKVNVTPSTPKVTIPQNSAVSEKTSAPEVVTVAPKKPTAPDQAKAPPKEPLNAVSPKSTPKEAAKSGKAPGKTPGPEVPVKGAKAPGKITAPKNPSTQAKKRPSKKAPTKAKKGPGKKATKAASNANGKK